MKPGFTPAGGGWREGSNSGGPNELTIHGWEGRGYPVNYAFYTVGGRQE